MNLSRLITLTFASIMAALMTSCDVEEICTSGQGSVVDSTIVVPTFTGFDLQVDGNVYLSQGERQSVRVVGQPNMLEKLNLSVGNQVWDIDLRGCVRNYEPLEVYITIPEIDYVRVSGSGNVLADSVLTIDDAEIILSGSGNVSLPVDADFVYTTITGSGNVNLDLAVDTKLETKVTGSGNYVLSGQVPIHHTEIVGSGNVMAFELATSETNVKISGSGDAEVFASDTLNIDISGSGDVQYRGNPSLGVKVTGSGRIVDAN